MSYRIMGFTDNGEVRIGDDEGRIIAYGELRLEDAYSELDRADVFSAEIRVNWTRDEIVDL